MTQPTSVENYKFGWFDWFCLWYPPGWLILFNRHWQHYHCDPDGWNWLEYGLFLIPGGFYIALLLRWLRLGCRTPRGESDEFDPLYQQAFSREILAPIVEQYFRGELRQIENLPLTGPLIVAMNHAGMCFPWDFLTLSYLLNKTRGWVVQNIAGISLFEHPWMTWWLPPGWSKVLGGIRAEFNDFEAAIAQPHEAISHGTILLYAPEGLRGPRKGWKNRYQIEQFHISFIQLSQRYQIPILPVICIGNENLHPWAVNIKRIQQLLKLPFLPLSPLMLLLLLFPSMGIWSLTSRLHYFIQPLLPLDLNNKTSNRSVTYQQAQQLKEQLQAQIERLIGKKRKSVEKL